MFYDSNALARRDANEHVAGKEWYLHQGAALGPSPCTKVKRQVGLHLPKTELFRHCLLVARKSVRRIPELRVRAEPDWCKINLRKRARLRLSQQHLRVQASNYKQTSYWQLLIPRLKPRRSD